MAQDAPARAESEIVVTAQKRAQSVQDVAAAISAVSGKELEDRGIQDVDALQFLVPGLEVGSLRIGGTYVTIRGVGLNQGAPGVAVHVDGVYQTDSAMADLAQADLERVEVLRGPQGTLYGRNANGGVINFITAKPKDRFEAEALAGYAEFQQSHLQGKLNIPIADGVRSRFVVDYGKRAKGFVRNIAGGPDLDAFERISGRAQLAIDLSDKATLDLSAAASHETGPTSFFQLATLPNAAAIATNPFLANARISLKPWTTTANDPSTSERNFRQVTGTLSWDLGFADLKSITAYTFYEDDFQTDSDGTNLSAFVQTNHEKSKTITQEINLSSSGKVADWVIGAYYLREKSERSLLFALPLGYAPLPPGGYLYSEAPLRKSKVFAVFGDATIHVTDRLNLIAGARYTKEDQVFRYSRSAGVVLGGNRIPLLDLCPPRTDTPDFSSFTPRAGLQYRLADNQNAYATISRGFKAGGVNISSCANIFQPEKITAYEAGYRSQWANDRLTFNLTGFYYDYTDLQLNQVTGLLNLITNAGAAEVYGAEVEAAWTPNGNVSIGGNLSWLNAEYSSFRNVDTLNPAVGEQDLAGNRLNNAPKWSANLSASLSTDPGPDGRFTLRGDLGYRSAIFLREFNTALDRQAGYALLGASLMWEDPGERFTLRLYGTNLTNKAYVAQGGSSDALGTLAITYGAPRQVGIEARVRY
jgi:iron complex outermembrane receptor protein